MPCLVLLVDIAINFILPWLIYREVAPVWGETSALLASSVPPVIWSIVELIRFRRVDMLSLLVVLGIVLSLVAMLMGGSSKMILMRESLVSGLIGVGFLLSLVLPRPLMFYLARATAARQAVGAVERFELLWQQKGFRQAMQRMTWLWGSGLTLEMAVKALMAWYWPTERFLLLAPVVGYGIYGALFSLTFLMRGSLRRAMLATA